MDAEKIESKYNFKGLFKYISTVISWTVFVLLLIIGVLLIYYYVSVRLYATKGEKYEPQFSVYTIVSESMEPTINKYDVIINTKVNDVEDVKINDVITFISTWKVTYGMTITHRVVGYKTLDNGDRCLVTRGDNNTSEDTACVEEKNIIGKVGGVIPGLGKIQELLSGTMGWLIVILLPALYIIIKDVLKLFGFIKSDNKKDTDKSNIKKNNKKLMNAYEDLREVKKK